METGRPLSSTVTRTPQLAAQSLQTLEVSRMFVLRTARRFERPRATIGRHSRPWLDQTFGFWKTGVNIDQTIS
jgi:hypothetical protein